MAKSAFDNLDNKVEQLLSYCAGLEEENRILLAERQTLEDQCQQLSQKNAVAYEKIEGLITKLKSRLTELE